MPLLTSKWRRNKRKTTVSGASPCHGFTLLEVVVGLALMASVLVSSLLAFSAHQRKRALADSKLAAVQAADQLLEQFTSRRGGLAPGKQGPVAGRPNWFWTTELVGRASPAGIPTSIIRVRIIRRDQANELLTLARVDVAEALP